MKKTIFIMSGALSTLAVCGVASAKDTSYKASVDVRESTYRQAKRCERRMDRGKTCTLKGFVFEDLNRDGRFQRGEPGIPGVLVSNGVDVVKTDHRGRYKLDISEKEGGTTVTMTKPAGYSVPVSDELVPQFFYHHLPEGSPELRFGGLEPTGPLPRLVNFPLIETGVKQNFKIVVAGDTQPYSNNEVGYVRDSLARDIAAMGSDDIELVMIEGDVMGDDLDLFPRFKSVMSVTDSPLYMVGGNHDLDFDATTDAHSFDTLRREWGPTNYSFDIGDVHFVGLDNVVYPCTPGIDNADGLHSFCDDPENSPIYNGRITDEIMTWLKNDLAHVPKDKLIVLNMHIPLVSFVDQYATRHQTDNARDLYELIGDRPALAFSGHTHTLAQFRPGESFEGWQTTFEQPLGPTPFPQIIAGAPGGSWWSGEFDVDGVPENFQRLGAPRGYLIIEFDGNQFRDTFKASGKPVQKQMSTSFLSPTFNDWYQELLGWLVSDPETRSDVTPVSINDLPDTRIITSADIEGGTYMVANVWNGSRDSEVYVQFNDGAVLPMTRTQEGDGEGMLETLDPYALRNQMYVLRYAIKSESGNERAQGFELFGGASFQGEPQPNPIWMLTDQSNHVWQTAIPSDLGIGAHTARVITVDVHGRSFEELIAFEVMDERPPAYFRSEVFE